MGLRETLTLKETLEAATPGKHVRVCSHASRHRHSYTDFNVSRVFCGKCGKTIYESLARLDQLGKEPA